MATAQRAPIYVSLDVWDEVEDMTEALEAHGSLRGGKWNNFTFPCPGEINVDDNRHSQKWSGNFKREQKLGRRCHVEPIPTFE